MTPPQDPLPNLLFLRVELRRLHPSFDRLALSFSSDAASSVMSEVELPSPLERLGPSTGRPTTVTMKGAGRSQRWGSHRTSRGRSWGRGRHDLANPNPNFFQWSRKGGPAPCRNSCQRPPEPTGSTNGLSRNTLKEHSTSWALYSFPLLLRTPLHGHSNR